MLAWEQYRNIHITIRSFIFRSNGSEKINSLNCRKTTGDDFDGSFKFHNVFNGGNFLENDPKGKS